jgi:tetratricopeptide (TPR) repeat protein
MGDDVESAQCSRCGAALPAGSRTGWCAGCALDSILKDDPGATGTASLSLRDLPVAGTSVSYIGDYELSEVVAYGGMGVVYRARQRTLNRVVALKLLLGGGHASADFKKRFRQEAETAAKLQHPNIVPIFEVGEHDGQPYFSMEFVAGTDLARLTRERPLPPRKAAEYVESVAEAIGYAHQQGVIHRDLKPSNILLGQDDRPRVTDFGLARRIDADSSLTSSGEMLGTPGYLPPEQASIKKGKVGPHSDVYALGAVLYYLLTGRPPFMAGTLAETLQQVLKSEPIAPRRLNPAIPCDLETICLKCLEKEPGRRYVSAQALAEDLGRFVNGEPILARPATVLERVAKWYRREPVVAGLATAVILVFGAGLAISTLLLLRERAARRIAVAETSRANEQSEIAAAVSSFLLDDVVGQASSKGQADARFEIKTNLTVREALQRAAIVINERFTNQPITACAVRFAIGDAYLGLGETQQGERIFDGALKLAQAKLGPTHEVTLRAMHKLARAYDYNGKPDDSVNLLKETLKLRTATLGAENIETINTMNYLANMYQNADRLDLALPLFENVFKLTRAKYGPENEDTLTIMHCLAGAYDAVGRHEEAIRLFEETRKLRERTLAPNHPDTLTTMNNLARAYLRARQLDRAITLFEETLKKESTSLGASHPDTLVTMNDLGVAFRTAGKFEKAILLFEEDLKLCELRFGTNHPDTVTVLNQLAKTYAAAGKPQQALQLFEVRGRQSEAAEWRRKLGTDNAPNTNR